MTARVVAAALRSRTCVAAKHAPSESFPCSDDGEYVGTIVWIVRPPPLCPPCRGFCSSALPTTRTHDESTDRGVCGWSAALQVETRRRAQRGLSSWWKNSNKRQGQGKEQQQEQGDDKKRGSRSRGGEEGPLRRRREKRRWGRRRRRSARGDGGARREREGDDRRKRSAVMETRSRRDAVSEVGMHGRGDLGAGGQLVASVETMGTIRRRSRRRRPTGGGWRG
jgi:hypothetical protein